MITDKLKELEIARTKLAALEQSISGELNQELASLPARFGFPDTDSFIAAFRSAIGKRRGRKPGQKNAAPTKAKEGKRRKRASITDETRADVKKLVNQGKTGSEIAEMLGISLPSVQNIKKALGLVKARK